MILNFDEIGTEKEAGYSSASILDNHPREEGASFPSSTSAQESTHQGIIMRVLHTRTELTIYPDGKSFVRNSQTWFEDKFYAPPAKKEKKKTESKTVTIDKMEEY